MRRARHLLLALLVLLLVAGVVALVGCHYLSSPEAAARVAASLEEVYGGPVQVIRVDLGFESTVLQGLRLGEVGDDHEQPEWATAEEVVADVSAVGLVSGHASPRRLTFRRPALTLRFNREGHLLTRLPRRDHGARPLPLIVLEDGRVTIQQEGHPDLVVDGIQATLSPEGGVLALAGTVADAHWGRWTLEGSLNPMTGAGSGTLQTTQIHLSEPVLRDLPFVSPTVWTQFQAEGDSPVELTLRYDPAGPAVHYRVALEPENTRLHVTAIDLHAHQARGKVLIEDGVAHLTEVQGRTAEGTIHTNGVLNFRSHPTQLQFDLTAERLDLRQLPHKWPLPPAVDGRLSGKADLLVTVVNGKAHTTGDGKGEISEARLFGLHARAIPLKMYADGERFHFKVAGAAPAEERAPEKATASAP
jgi:translocation and assembly module TamB